MTEVAPPSQPEDDQSKVESRFVWARRRPMAELGNKSTLDFVSHRSLGATSATNSTIRKQRGKFPVTPILLAWSWDPDQLASLTSD